jgi:hypothetical protein
LASRYRDHNALVGNLHPGQSALAEPVLEVIPMRIIGDYQAELDRIRAHNFAHAYAARPFRSAPFRHSIHRRG